MGFTVPPSIEDIEAIADGILDELPEALRKHTSSIKIQVEDFPDAFIEQEMELETPFDLLGCYLSDGRAAVGHMGKGGKREDVLYLYRRPILDSWADSGEDLARLVNRVMLQEIGHHFGYAPEEIELYEEDMIGATAASMMGAG